MTKAEESCIELPVNNDDSNTIEDDEDNTNDDDDDDTLFKVQSPKSSVNSWGNF